MSDGLPAGRRRNRRIGLSAALLLLASPAVASAGEIVERLDGHGGPVTAIAVSPDGTKALTGSFDYSVGLWSLRDARLSRWLEGHRAAVDAVAFLPDGERVLSAGDDFDLVLWNSGTGERLRTFSGHRGKVSSIAVSPDGRLAATGGWDGWIGLWDLTGDAPVRWLKGHEGPVADAAFGADGATLYSGGQDGTIRRWGVATEGQEKILARHGFGVNRIVLDEGAGWLAYGAVDGAMRALDVATGEQIADLSTGRRPVLAMATGPDGRLLAVGDGAGFTTIIDTTSWSVDRDFRAVSRGPVWALAWTADGERLLTGGIDEAVVIRPIAATPEAAGRALAETAARATRGPDRTSNGESQFARTCAACHTLTPDGGRRAGPTLWGLFGRRAGSVEDYRYSRALAGSGIVWSEATIDRLFSEGPEHFTPGSKMPMQRMTDPQDRRDLITFLAENTGPRADEDADR